jgi:hypothetical protein
MSDPSRRRTGARAAALVFVSTLLAAAPGPAAAGPPPVAPGDLLGSTGNRGRLLISIDPATGAGTLRFPIDSFGPVTEIEFRADGVLFASTGQGSSTIITIDPDTGVETLVGQHAFGAVNGLEFVGDTLYGSFVDFAAAGAGGPEGAAPSRLVIVDQTDGSLATVGPFVDYLPVRGLAYDPATGTLYGVGSPPGPDPQGDTLFTIDPTDGSTTAIGFTGFSIGGIELGTDGVLYGGTTSGGALLSIDLATGAATVIGSTGFSALSGLSFVPAGEPIFADGFESGDTSAWSATVG